MALVVGTNAYISVANADAYFVDRVSADTWDGIDPTFKAQAIVTGSEIISLALIETCQFPIDPGDINAQVANAAAEYALVLAQDPTVADQANTGSNLKSLKAGSVELEFFRPDTGARFPTQVLRLLQASECLAGDVNVVLTPSVSGTTQINPLGDDDYGLSEGYP